MGTTLRFTKKVPSDKWKLFLFNCKILSFSLSLFIILIVLHSSHVTADSDSSSPSGMKQLVEEYHKVKGNLEKNNIGLPLYIASTKKKDTLHGDVFGIIGHSFTDFQDILQQTTSWCDILLLHLNIKACTFSETNGTQFLTLYTGRKYYQPAEDAYEIFYTFTIREKSSGYIEILLSADNGPLNTRDHHIDLRAMHLDEDRTFVHFSYTYKYGLLAWLVTEGYFATLGFGKTGFSVISTDSMGNPVYPTGIRGAIERNSVRYYFAIQSYLYSLSFSEEERFYKRISHWYDLTDQFKSQLFEMEKEDYIRYKEREYRNQLKLQSELNNP